MKLTWFGGNALRIHLGGQIIVANPSDARHGTDGSELVAGADRVFDINGPAAALPEIDPSQWHRRRPRPLSDGEAVPPVDVLRIGAGAVLVEAIGEPLVVLVTAAPPRFGRWANESVIVLLGSAQDAIAIGTTLLDVAQPRLIALADDEEAVDAAVEALREHLDGVGLVALEPAMAVEV